MTTVQAGDKVIRLRRYSFDEKSEIEVTLRPTQFSTEWTVLHDGQEIGTVGKYTGSLERPRPRGSRIRRPGVRRTLWSHRGTDPDARTEHDHVSRADAIRWLLNEAGIR